MRSARPRARARARTLVAVLLGLPVAAAAQPTTAIGPGPYDRFFPFRLGDSWTYDWHTEGRREAAGKPTRTRTFESTEFVGGGVAYKVVSDDGSYHVYTLRGGTLALVTSSEAGRVLYYDPPVPLATADQKPGQTVVTYNADTQRTWRTTFEGFEDVTTRLGVLKGCLKIRLEMASPDYVSDSRHFFAPGVGLVAYRYELRPAGGNTAEVRIDAQLRLARLAGVHVTRLADLAKLDHSATVRLVGTDDPSARAILKKATERRYTWDEKFPGFRGSFEYAKRGQPAVRGSFHVDRQLDVKVSAPTEETRALIRNQLSSFLSHRKFNPFELAFAGASFKKAAVAPDGEVEILTEGDSMGTRYTVRSDEIVRVGRSAGRLRFETTTLGQLWTEDDRYITVEYELAYYRNEDGALVSRERMRDSYARVGSYWLPTGRETNRTDGAEETLEFQLKLTDLKSP